MFVVVLQWNKRSQKQKGSIPDQNIQKDVKKNTKRTCLDFLLNQISKLWKINKDWLYTLKAAIFNYAKCFFLEYRVRNASRVNAGV